MPIKLNFGFHETARDAEARYKMHFREADAFVFEHTQINIPDEQVEKYRKPKGGISKKEIVDKLTGDIENIRRRNDAFIEGKGFAPTHENIRRMLELLREENVLRKAEGRSPLVHYWEPFDYRIAGHVLDFKVAQHEVFERLKANDYEGFLSKVKIFDDKYREYLEAREFKVAKLAKSLEARKKIHVGVEMGAAHFGMHEKMKSEGVDVLEPFFQDGFNQDFWAEERKAKTPLEAGIAFVKEMVLADQGISLMKEYYREKGKRLTEEKLKWFVSIYGKK